jgi:mono/diheme cytochrome c family protein
MLASLASSVLEIKVERQEPAMAGSRVKTVLLTFCACVVLAVLGAVGFIYSGLYDVAAINPDNPAVTWALHKASDRSVAARLGDIQVPSGLDKAEVIAAGAKLFGENCVVCHGGPGLKPTGIARGLNPPPPDLFRTDRDASLDETFWFIKNGVKMTGMPGFGKTRSDDEIWSLTAFLRTAPGMLPLDFAVKAGIGTPAPDAKPSGG